MEKNFDQWNNLKQTVHKRENSNVPFFNEREIWWCHLGVNIGWEQDGKHEQSLRPVVVLKKFVIPQKKYEGQPPVILFWALPTTSRSRSGRFYHSLDAPDNENIQSRTAILSQIRLLDAKRLVDKVGTVPNENFKDMKKAIIDILR